MTINLRTLKTTDPGFAAELARLLDRARTAEAGVEADVREIIAQVRARGDAALLDYTRRFDRPQPASAAALEIPRPRLAQARRSVAPDRLAALETAADRIRVYHERQKLESWSYTEADGTMLGQRVTPLEHVGLYVPGGKAAYPSSVLMNAIPARVAGVSELIMATPAPDGELNDMVLAAAAVAGVDRVFAIGGAQAIAALAHGTETVPRVDKIVGPGNVYVATAKRLVFGAVDIDMIAGPSEIVVVCAGRARRGRAGDPDQPRRRVYRKGPRRRRAAAAHARTARHHRGRARGARGADRRARSGRGRDARQPHRPRAPGTRARRRRGGRGARAPRGRDLPRAQHARGARRLLRRPEPRAADRGHGALLIAPGRVRFPEAHEPDPVLREGRDRAGPDRLRARARGRAGGARALGGVSDKKIDRIHRIKQD